VRAQDGASEVSRDPTRILSAGILATLMVLLAGTGYSFVALQHAITRERTVVATSERVTALISKIAEDLSRERATVLEAMTEEPVAYPAAVQSVDEMVHQLDQSITELAVLIPASEQPAWNKLGMRVRTFENDVALAFALARRGDPGGAEEILDRVAAHASALFGDLAVLIRVHGEYSHQLVSDTEKKLRVALTVALLTSLLTSLAVLGIWLVAVRQLRRQQHALALYTRRIEGANRELDAFAGRVAHDLKNILSPIPLANDLIRAHPGEAVLVERSAQRVNRSINNAVDVLDGLLSFTRAGEAPANGEPVSVADEALAVVDELQPLVAQLGAEIRLDIDASTDVVCGHSLLHVVLLNVIGNAVKFLADRPVRKVWVRARCEGAHTVIEIEDTGPGIAAGDLQRIFEPFYRAQDATAKGHGIGLATVQRIVHRCGGHIDVASTLGKGSVFSIFLPRLPPGASGRAGAFQTRPVQLAGS